MMALEARSVMLSGTYSEQPTRRDTRTTIQPKTHKTKSQNRTKYQSICLPEDAFVARLPSSTAENPL